MKLYTREELDEYLCENYCRNANYGQMVTVSIPNGLIMCEGCYGKQKYEKYLNVVEDGEEDHVNEE